MMLVGSYSCLPSQHATCEMVPQDPETHISGCMNNPAELATMIPPARPLKCLSRAGTCDRGELLPSTVAFFINEFIGRAVERVTVNKAAPAFRRYQGEH